MIKRLLILVAISVMITSCGSSKQVTTSTRNIKTTRTRTVATPKTVNEVTVADKIVWTAVTYKGVPYRYGGTSMSGMDCSGLIHTSFTERDVDIPRTSRQMYYEGYPISLKEVQRGDLLFFKTSYKSGKINHVGLVTSADDGDIRFIHSTTSRGVIVTSLDEPYWKKAFVKAKRVL
ncbi:C40 family peptidase [Tenacibaculum sp. IB213877]|uniref:C40 family peptidase n=1 Tax=Tenacibaculum sp. IB213877 TaxID=3097351 RepID=UPI002A5B047A|nr:C40 family peptidase [Tenacibaculum sp. IB213877]MDY0780680.1 C40 family peptidase [Tenacibaculum sp. IB213877]